MGLQMAPFTNISGISELAFFWQDFRISWPCLLNYLFLGKTKNATWYRDFLYEKNK